MWAYWNWSYIENGRNMEPISVFLLNIISMLQCKSNILAKYAPLSVVSFYLWTYWNWSYIVNGREMEFIFVFLLFQLNIISILQCKPNILAKYGPLSVVSFEPILHSAERRMDIAKATQNLIRTLSICTHWDLKGYLDMLYMEW